MDITDAEGKWRLTDGYIENRKTMQSRRVQGIPSAGLDSMHYETFMRRCAVGFNTGHWPGTESCSSCGQITNNE